MARRTDGGVHSATASIAVPLEIRSPSDSKHGTFSSVALRLTPAANLNSVFLAMQGRCWSVAILPSPTTAILKTMCWVLVLDDAGEGGEKTVNFRRRIVVRQPHTQNTALVEKPHASHRLNGIVVAGPDKH